MNKITLADILKQIGMLPMEEILKMSVGDLIQYFNVADPAPSATTPAFKEPNPHFREIYRKSKTLPLEQPLETAPYGETLRSGDGIYIRIPNGHFAIKETSFAGSLHFWHQEGDKTQGITLADSDLQQLINQAIAQKPTTKTPNFDQLLQEVNPLLTLDKVEEAPLGMYSYKPANTVYIITSFGMIQLSPIPTQPGNILFFMPERLAIIVNATPDHPFLVTDDVLHDVLAGMNNDIKSHKDRLARDARRKEALEAERLQTAKQIDEQVGFFRNARAESEHVCTKPEDIFAMVAGEDCQMSVNISETADLIIYGKMTPTRIRLLATVYDEADVSTDFPKFYRQELPLDPRKVDFDWSASPTAGYAASSWNQVCLDDSINIMKLFSEDIERDFSKKETTDTNVVTEKKRLPASWGNALHARLFQDQATLKNQPARVETPEVLAEHLKEAAQPASSTFHEVVDPTLQTMLQEKVADDWIPDDTRATVVTALEEDFHVAIENVTKQSGMKGLDRIALEFVQDDCRYLLQSLLAAIPAVTSHIPLIPLRGNGVWCKFIDKSQCALAVFVHIADVRYELHYAAGKITIYQSNVGEQSADSTLEAADTNLPATIFIQLYVSILARAILMGREPVDIRSLMIHSTAILKSWRSSPEFKQ